VECEHVEYWHADTLEEFIDVLQRKKRILVATSSPHKFHFVGNSIFCRVPSLTGFVDEGDDGIRSFVVLPIRSIFEAEEAAGEWPHAAWFFPAWRLLLHNGELVRIFEFFFNRLDGDFGRVPAFLADRRTALREGYAQLELDINSVNLSVSDREMQETVERLCTHHIMWAKMLSVIEEYVRNAKECDKGGH
jgi:hypothetical protein